MKTYAVWLKFKGARKWLRWSVTSKGETPAQVRDRIERTAPPCSKIKVIEVRS